MTKRIRYGMGALAALAVLLSACGTPVQKVAGQTGEPNTTVTTATTVVPTTALDTSEYLVTTTIPGDGVVQADGAAPAERTVLVNAGVFATSALSVSVGDLVTFKGKGNIASRVTVGDAPWVVVTADLVQSFRFTKPGTIEATTDEVGALFTIHVTGEAGAPATGAETTTTTTASTTTTAP